MRFLRGFILKPTDRARVFLKIDNRDFQNSPLFENRHVFMGKLVEIFNAFKTLTLKQIFWKMKNFFEKLEHRFLVKNTKIENASFP